VTNNSSYAQIVNSSIRYINTGFSLSLVYVAWLFRCSKYGKTPREGLALRKVGWKANVGAIFLGMILGTFSYFIALLHSAAQPSVMNNAPITKMITSPGGQITFLLLILVAPPCEEIFFRGFLFPVLRNKWGLVAGVVLSSFAFAYIHGYQVNRDVVSLSVIFMIGLVFALERQKFHSTIPSILTHWTYNITVAALGVIVMGLMAFQHAKPRPTVVHRSIPSSEEVKKDLLGHVIGKSGKMPWSCDSLSEFKQFAPTGKKETSRTLDLSYTVYLKGSIGPWSRANIVVHYRQVGTGYVFAGVDDYHSLTVMKK
jgi:membrane protease YdiL (CAAX protease family)